MKSSAQPQARSRGKSQNASVVNFTTDRNGRVEPSQQNIRTAIALLSMTLSHDTFAERLLINGRYLSDAELDRLYLDIDEKFKLRTGREFFETVIKNEARKNAFHPVCDYLNKLKWDRRPRMDRWLIEHAGAKDTPYTRAVSRLVLVAAVRRVRQPGAKFDEMLVLESDQGTNKSSALRVMAVNEDWFSDDLPLSAKGKEIIEQLSGKWIVEAGELRGMRKGDIDALKAMLSRQVDRARMAYGRMTSEYRRQCVIIGTTNNEQYLKDHTGNRRFWPIKVDEFDLDALRLERDQLWAEAAVAEAAGESIRLDPELYDDAAAEQKKRYVPHPWLERLSQSLGNRKGKLMTLDAWRVVGFDPSRAEQYHNQQLGDCMRQLGFERQKRRFGGTLSWAYVKGERHERDERINVRSLEGGNVDVWQKSDRD